MARVCRLERAAILTAALIVAACGNSAAPQPIQTPSAATRETASNAMSTPAVEITQATSDQSLPSGVTVVDTANGIQRLDWSPSGKLLAVLTWGWEFGLGQADILDLTGRKIASFTAFDMAWVDDTHLMTLVVSPNDAAHGTVTVHSIVGTENSVLPGTFGAMLGNGHGSVALAAPVVGSSYTVDESFRIWSDGQLGQPISGYGHPVRWSADGRLLALVSQSPTGAGPHAVGGPIPGSLHVMKLPEKTVALSRPLADIRLDVYFSPDGTRLATSDGVVLNLSDARSTQLSVGSVQGWTSAGELVVVGQDHRVSLWTPAATTVVPSAFEWAYFGPEDGDIATLPEADDNLSAPVTAVVRRTGGEVSIPLNVGLSMAVWSSTGICFITTGTADMQLVDNRLLRIDLPER